MQGQDKAKAATQTSSYSHKPRGDSIDYGDKRETRRKSGNSDSLSKTPETRGSSTNLLISTNASDYKKLSKSTNDARTSSQIAITTTSNYRSVSSSSGGLQNKLITQHKDDNRSKSSKTPDRNERTEKPERSERKVRSDHNKSNPRSPLKASSNQLDNNSTAEPDRIRRHRRKKSKQKRGESRRKPAVKHNPAALDFLKGISLGENTPTLKHRKSYHGKSKLSEVYPQKQNPQDTIPDTILFAGSSSTKKIKIAEFAAQTVPGKIYLSTRTSSTFAVFSLIKFDGKSNKKDKEKVNKEALTVSAIGKLKSVAAGTPVVTNAPKSDTPEVAHEQEYDPYFLDDPSLTTGKHRTVMNLASFKESIIPYVRPGVIKDELNELFRQKHPWVPHGVTLHKIRKLKKALVVIGVAGGLEVSTVAIAYVLFEKLILKGLITKPLIRLYGAVCLILAAKSNDPRGNELKATLEAIEKQLDVEHKDLFMYEFPIFSAFACCLLLPAEHVIPHIRVIIKDHEDLVGNPY